MPSTFTLPLEQVYLGYLELMVSPMELLGRTPKTETSAPAGREAGVLDLLQGLAPDTLRARALNGATPAHDAAAQGAGVKRGGADGETCGWLVGVFRLPSGWLGKLKGNHQFWGLGYSETNPCVKTKGILGAEIGNVRKLCGIADCCFCGVR